MYGCIKQQLKHLTKEEYLVLKELCHAAKNLYNEALYNIRQHFFQTGKYLSYNENYKLLKNSVNYQMLNSNMSQQILKKADHDFASFFGLLKLAKKGQYDYRDIHIPHYLDKNGFTNLLIGFVRLKDNYFILPYSNTFKKNHKGMQIKLPSVLQDKVIKEIRILPKADARFFEIQYVYETGVEEKKLNNKHVLAIDLGINNFCTCVTNKGKSFIIDGKKLKSINQWFNKENARLQSIKDKQKTNSITRQQSILWNNRNNVANDYVNKTVRLVINYCLKNNIGAIAVGCNKDIQKDVNLGHTNNQNFVNIPVGIFRKKLKAMCLRYGIQHIEQEESYTSKASFFDKDKIPVYDKNSTKKHKFSGKRIHRGLYRTAKGYELNADVNGALNILKKSNVVSLMGLYRRGEVDTPVRIRIV